MEFLKLTVIGVLALLILILAYKIGKVLMRLAFGLLFLGALGYMIWKYLIHP